MEAIKIISDSSADLGAETAQALDVDIVPLTINVGGRSFLETAVSRDEFWRLSETAPASTSQPAPGSFHEVFRHWVDRGYHIVCITISSRLSGTYAVAWDVAQEFGDRVTVVDSVSVSRGHAAQVIKAVERLRGGDTLAGILAAVQRVREHTHVFLELDTLEALRRGGRASKLLPVFERMAQALQLKPLIAVSEGELKLHSVVRTYARGVNRIRDDIARYAPLEQLCVVHTRCVDVANRLADQLCQRTAFPRDRVAIVEAGAVIACHAGRGLIGAVGVAAG